MLWHILTSHLFIFHDIPIKFRNTTLLKAGVSLVRLQGRGGSVTIFHGQCEALEHAALPLIAAGAAKAQRESAPLLSCTSLSSHFLC